MQRVPETEAKGRIHTSAATVAVMAEPEDVEIELKPDDYRVDRSRQRAGRAARQQDRLGHPPDALGHRHRRQLPGREEPAQEPGQGPARLKTRLYEAKRRQEHAKRASERKSKIGSGDRSERIRTYNFPQNRITDHRINLTLYKLDNVLAGNLDPCSTPSGIRAAGAARRLRHDRVSVSFNDG